MAKKRKRPVQERSRATVDAIVEATRQVFEQDGFSGTTTTRIAERAGVSVGSLYQYFPDKKALIAAFFERRMAQDVAMSQAILARSAGAPPVALVRIATEEAVALFRTERDLYRSVAEVMPFMEQTPEVQSGIQTLVAFTAGHLRANEELLGGRDPDLVARVMIATLRASLFKVVMEMPDKLDDPALVEILLGGLLGILGLPPDAA